MTTNDKYTYKIQAADDVEVYLQIETSNLPDYDNNSEHIWVRDNVNGVEVDASNI